MQKYANPYHISSLGSVYLTHLVSGLRTFLQACLIFILGCKGRNRAATNVGGVPILVFFGSVELQEQEIAAHLNFLMAFSTSLVWKRKTI